MEKTTITETPKIIPAGDLSATEARQYYKDFSNDKRTKEIDNPFNIKLVKAGDRFAVMNDETGRIDYLMIMNERKINGMKCKYQSFVWRSISMPRGLAIFVFFNYLLPIYGKAVTDRLQTDLGSSFWRGVIDEAIKTNKYVYAIDLNTNSVSEIKDHDDYHNIKDVVWGSKEANKARLIMISDEKIFESKKMSESLDSWGMPY